MAGCRRKDLRLRATLAALLAFLMLLSAGSAVASRSGGSSGRTHVSGRAAERHSLERERSPASRRWRVKKGGTSSLKKSSFWNRRPFQFSTPKIASGMLFVGVDAGVFYAFDLERNRRVWRFFTDGPIQSQAGFSNDTVYVGDVKGVFYALSSADGELRWRAQLDTEIMAAPLLVGGRVYVSTMSGRLYAMDAETGAAYWNTGPDDREFGFTVRRAAAPSYGDGLIYQGTGSGYLRAVRESDASTAWRVRLGDIREMVYDVDSSPLINHGILFAASADGGLFALDPRTGSLLWSSDAGGVNDLEISGGRLLSTGRGRLYSQEPSSGNLFWEQNFDAPAVSSPAAGEGFIAVASTTDKIYIVESATGDIAFQRFIKKGSLGDPVVHEGRVYVLSNSGRLFRFSVEPRSLEKRPDGKDPNLLNQDSPSDKLSETPDR